MDQDVINNVASNYAHEYGLTDCLDELKKLIKNHGGNPFHIFRYMSFVKKLFDCFKKWNISNCGSQSKGISFFKRLKEKILYSS